MRSAVSLPHLRAAAVAVALLAAASAQAGLFDDDEARRAIVDMRTRITQSDEQRRADVKRLEDQIQQLRNSLLDAANQNEALRSELAQLRGKVEQTARDAAEVQTRQQAMATSLQQLEPQSITLDGETFTATPEEVKAYNDAMAPLKSGQYTQAATLLAGFARQWTQSGYLPSVRYWLGNAYYADRKTKDALTAFRAFTAAYPQHPRVPEAKLAIANCQIDLRDTAGAKRTLGDLIKAHPQSEAANAARDRLAAL